MENKAGIRQYLTLIGLFAFTALLLGFTVDIRITDEAGVRTSLPERLGQEWIGYDVLFCHNKRCDRSWLVKDLTPNETGEYTCPRDYAGNACGGKLHPMAYGEWDNLPKDTTIFKKQYFNLAVSNLTAFCAVVLSGEDRSSIHRPQVCLIGQGNEIVRQTVIAIPIEGREPLEVMVLDLIRDHPRGGKYFSYYAYWFVGKDRETAHHTERMVWMGVDRILRNVAHRWAYISVSGERSSADGDESHHATILEVIGKLYPQISLIDHEG
jgi:hypothetical protein